MAFTYGFVASAERLQKLLQLEAPNMLIANEIGILLRKALEEVPPQELHGILGCVGLHIIQSEVSYVHNQ
jgi:hypothetical protein